MKQSPSGVWTKSSKKNHTSFTRSIGMYYTTAYVATFTEDHLIDFSGFVSAVGGNLGLFLGFSFLGMLFSLYEYIENVVLSKSTQPATKNVVKVSQASFSRCH